MSALRQLLVQIVTLSLALFYAACIFFSLLFRTMLNPRGPYFWHKKQRNTPPKCLTDPAYGTHKYIQLSGIKLHYVENGDSSKPLMLFVHGFPDFWYSWRHQIREFSKDYRTVAVDMRGFADSAKPSGINNYHIDYLVKDLKELVEALGCKKCILVAHDWGGIIGWQFVMKHPEMIEKYIIMAAPQLGPSKRYILSSIKQFLMSWYVFFFQFPWLPEILMASNDFRALERIIRKPIAKFLVTDEDMEAYKYAFGKPGGFRSIHYYRANFFLKQDTDCMDNYIIKDIPGLLIIPENDVSLSVELLKESKNNAPDVQLEILKNADHFIHEYDPETVNKLMRNFL